MKNSTSVTKKRDILKENAKGYPPYSPDDDIYVMDEKENLDPDEMGKDGLVSGKVVPESNSLQNNNIGSGLDIPGAELDDTDEETGNEDEENNYYSLGGDNHEDLEEDNG